MKQTFIKSLLVLCTLSFFAVSNVKAVSYTASSSGNFSSPSTWLGGNVPPSTIGANDIIINSGVTVTLDRNIIVSSTFSLFQMKGTAKLVSTSKNYLSVNSGNFTGAATCSIDIDSVYIGSAASIQYFGSITANTIALSGSPLTQTIDITVNKTLRLMGLIAQLVNGNLTLGTGTPRPVIVFAGGGLLVGSGATVGLANPYDVRYEDPSKSIGLGWELLGTGLTDIEVAIGSSNSTSLAANLNVNGGLKLTSGTLDLNSFDLTFGANSTIDAGGTGSLSSSGGSDIMIQSTASAIGTLRFDATNNMIDNFTMNTGSSNGTLEVGSDLTVMTKLDLQSGKINIKGNNLIINAAGAISGGSANSYVITETGGALRQDIAANATATYHVGHSGAYLPAMVESKNNTTYSEMGVNVVQGVNEQLTSGANIAATKPAVDATWTINQNSTTGLDYSIDLMWSASSEVNSFDRSKSYITHYTSGSWDVQTTSAATTSGSTYAQKRENISTVGSFAVFDENTVGINDVITKKTINLYPNPAKGDIHVNVEEATQATIYSVAGQVVNSTLLNSSINTINISNLPAGMYHIHLIGESTKAAGQFIKE